MQISRNKAKVTTTIILMLLMATGIIMTYPVQAQTNVQEGGGGPLPSGVTPDTTFDAFAQLSFRPTTIGVGQTFLVNLWVTPAIHPSRYFKDFKVTITKPDGKQDVITMDSYKADGTAWFEYVADQIGTWTLKFDFQGAYFPRGNYTSTGGAFGGTLNAVQSAYYKPSSSPLRTLIVQADPVYPWPTSALPTDIWTRPVHVENREWWTISGNWPATGYVGFGNWDSMYPDTSQTYNSRHKFTPWVQGPNSAHIVWKEQGNIAGLTGGQTGQYGVTGSSPVPNIIYAGRCYESYSKPGTGSTAQTYWRCYDLRTGQTYWEQPVSTITSTGFFFGPSVTALVPNIIEYTGPQQSEVAGASAAGAWSVNLIYIGGGRLYKWNPWTGAMTTNISISPLSSATFYKQSVGRGSEPMALSIQDLGEAAGADRYRLINWTTASGGYGSSISDSNFSTRVRTNTSYARSSLPSYVDWNTGYGATVSGVTVAGVYMGMNLTGYNAWTGQTLWSKIINEPVYSGVCDIVDHNTLAVLSDRGYYVGTDLVTGAEKWKSDPMHYPWTSTGFGAYSSMSAYGMFYRESYDGIYAFNWTNGKIVWHYEAPTASPFETPYTGWNDTGVYPFYSFGVGGIIADGKFYTWTYEHTESWPVTRGWGIHVIDCFTGKGVWNLTGCIQPVAIADGYLVGTNSYDGYKYVFGKGKSVTTVTAPDVTVPLGSAITIKGSVLDQSPAQPGTPCVSKDSMKTQMDYLHMQLPIDGIWHNVTMTGVEVSLTAIGSDGNYVNIGKATTDSYYGTFKFAWTPPKEGAYQIMANFAGDDSYGSSGASTAVTVGPAPAQAQQIDVPAPADMTPLYYLVVGATVAIIIAVAVVGLLLLRKRQ
ncbi:MAG: PQQ-binding-like beta-propeller repeat protein [Chloroflexota bacterium]